MEKTRGRVYHKRCPYDYENVGLGGKLGGFLEHRHRFLEEHYMRAHFVAFDNGVGVGALLVADLEHLALVVEGAHFGELAVEMGDI